MRIALTSCAKVQSNSEQKIWRQIQNQGVSALLFLGDFVYLDKLTKGSDPDWEAVRALYDQQLNVAGLQRLLANGIDFHAIWDDHDFFSNDIFGSDLAQPVIDQTTSIFLEKLFPGQVRENVYYSVEYSELKMIFLDVRSYRTPGETILGTTQQEWLVDELDHEKRYTVVCSGSTLDSRRIGSHRGKTWKEHEASYDWIRTLLSNHPRTLFLSGDIHKNKFVSHLDGAFHEVIGSGAARRVARERFAVIDFSENVTIGLVKKGKQKRTIVIDGDSWEVTADSGSGLRLGSEMR